MPYTMPNQLMKMKQMIMRNTEQFSEGQINRMYRKFNKQKQLVQQQLKIFSEDISVPQMINKTLDIEDGKFKGDLQRLVQEELSKNSLQKPINFQFKQLEEEFKNDFYRFSEKKSDDEEDWKNEEFTPLKIKSVWASSVLTGKYQTGPGNSKKKVTYLKFPAEDILVGGKKYWCSTGQHKIDDEVVMKIELNEVRQVNYVFVSWAYAPGKVAVHVSTDGENFHLFRDFEEAAQGEDWRQLASKFWHWKQHYQSFVQHINLQASYVKVIKLVMKDNVFNYFGIYQVEVFTKTMGVMLRMKAEGGREDCLVVGDEQKEYKDEKGLMMMNCIEALEMLESREVFFIETDWKISTGQNRDKCLMTLDGVSTIGTPIIVGGCGDQGYKEWVINQKGMVQLKIKPSMCMQVTSGESVANRALNQQVEASSTTQDNNHLPSMVNDGSPETYWASANGEQEVSLKLTFQNMQTINRIVVQWREPAKVLQVRVMASYKQWETVYSGTGGNREQKRLDIRLVAMKVSSIQLEMKQPLEKGHFSIDDLRVENGMRKVVLMGCDDNIATNQFIMEPSEFVELSVKDKLLEARAELAKQGAKLSVQVQANIKLLKTTKLQKVFLKGKELKKRMEVLEEQLSTLDSKLGSFREHFDQTVKLLEKEKETAGKRGQSGLVGTSSDKPGKDCLTIQQVLNHKVSGYYWVKGECQHVPFRVYCDFSNGGGFYAYLGGIKEGDDYRAVVNSVQDVRFKCAQIGLQALDIISANQLQLVRKYILDLQIVMKKEVVPLAYDYHCETGKCQNRFKSLLSETSADVTNELKELVDSDNIANMEFSRASYSQIDGIGFAQNKGLLQYFMFGKFVVKGVLCSDNQFNSKKQVQFVEADCSTVVRGHPGFQGILNSKVKVICPKNCHLKSEFQVWGSMMYKDDSSVCRAAIHAGQLEAAEGGQIEVGFEKGVNGYTSQYRGTEANQVLTLSYPLKWDRSFLVNKYVLVCPIDAFKARLKNSFIQISTNSLLIPNTNSLSIPNTNSLLMGNSYIQTSSDDSLSSQSLLSSLADSKNMENIWQQDQQRLQQADEEGTEIAIKELVGIYQRERKYLKKYLKMQQDAKDLTFELNKLTTVVKSTDISGQALSQRIAMNLKHLEGTGGIQELQLKDALSRTQLTYRLLQLTKLKKLELQKWLGYSEKYEYLLTDVYSIHDHPGASKGPSTWQLGKNSLEGHTEAIFQTSGIKCSPADRCTATLLLLNRKSFYDGQLSLTMFFRDNGLAGVVFRAKDAFNYYVLEMSQKEGFKRVRKVVGGVATILHQDDDGGYAQDKWYKLKITMKQGIFKIYLAEEKSEALPEIIHFEDQQLTQGMVGLSVNDNTGFFVDKLVFNPLDCSKEPQRSQLLYKPHLCSRFQETYFGQLSLRWKVQDPKNAEAGPSVWKIADNVYNRDKAILQNAKIFSGGSDQVPSILELFYIYRSCRSGFVSFQFFGVEDGAIGVGLKYQNQDNFYLLEFQGGKKKQVTFKKVLDGRYILLGTDPETGYTANKWHSVQIYMVKSDFRVFLALPDEQPQQVFPEGISDEDFKEGGLALTTFRTRAAFDQVTFKPIADLPTEEKEEEDEVSQQIEAIKLKAAGGERKQQVFQNENVKTMSWDKCLLYKTLKERQQHCSVMFSFDNKALENCNEKYCSTCCENEIDVLHLTKRQTCRKECRQAGVEERVGKPWQGCVTSIKPQNSVYSYCKQVFQEQDQQQECAVGFCDLCCINSERIWNLSFDDVVMQECHVQCREVYGAKQQQESLVALPT